MDDERYARRFAEDKRELERWGVDRIERELARRGIEPELIAATLSAYDRDDELAAAVALLAERHPPGEGDRERDRAWRMLVRKGYEPEVAYDAVRAHARRDAA
ncbi:MAG: regulatory protein RecX [Thermoleophilaceae bacterium]